MFKRASHRSLTVLALAIAATLPASGASQANGPCGQDFDGDHACGLSSPASASGSLTTDNEKDYYVFHASKGTELSVTITDTESPTCSEGYDCGRAHVELLEANGDETFQEATSEPNNGITVPGTVEHTIEAGGTYYLVVSGGLGDDSNGNPTPVPYTLSVNASPGVQWPAPPTTVRRCAFRHIHRHRHEVRVRTCKTVSIPG